jgi:hypothetical protein
MEMRIQTWRSACLAAACASISIAQEDGHPTPPWLDSVDVPVRIDSGLVEHSNTGRGAEIVFSVDVAAPGAPWVRMRFDEIILPGGSSTANGSYLVITSHLDGATQFLDAVSVDQWRNTSAYFNGDAVSIDLIAYPGTGDNRLAMSSIVAGVDPAQPASICGNVDDRELSNDPRCARALPVTCSASIIDDCNYCMTTAGHCVDGLEVLEFNVPLSNPNGTLVHPPPEDQYAVDPVSIQSQTINGDWAYFGCFPNANTGLTAAEAQGDYFVLAPKAPPMQGQDIRVTGYGAVSFPVDPTWHLAQKTHVGPFVFSNGSIIRYAVDTTSGNSGSPVIDETTGEAFGVHTSAGCNALGGNTGTSVNNSEWKAALAAPKGICAPLGSCTCQADFNDDGSLDVLDFVAVQKAFTAGDLAADFDDDGMLTVLDFVAYQTLFVAGCP